MKAYLLAAGYATRMYPLTRDCAKPLLEVAGAAIISHLLRRVLTLDGLSEVIVVANDRFAADFEAWAAQQSSLVPLRVLNDGTRSDDDKLGALGDLEFALREAPLEGEDWLVAAADNLISCDLRPLQRVFERGGEVGREPLLVVRRTTGEGPSQYNEVILAESGRVTGFREKPRDPVSDLAAIALYLLPAAAGPALERYLVAGGNRDAPGHFLAWLVEQMAVRAEPLQGAWFDIGSLDGLADARARFSVDG
jgi:glucose-1-phosphate thymidylyltransferase